MPAAIDFATLAGISPRSDGKIVIYSENYSTEREFRGSGPARAPASIGATIPSGVVSILAGEGHKIPGFSLSLWGMSRSGRAFRVPPPSKSPPRSPYCRSIRRQLSRPGAGPPLPARRKRVRGRQLRHHGPVHLRQRRRGSRPAARLPRPQLQACAHSRERGPGHRQHHGQARRHRRRIHQPPRAKWKRPPRSSPAIAPKSASCAMPPLKIWRNYGARDEPQRPQTRAPRHQRKPAHRGRRRRPDQPRSERTRSAHGRSPQELQPGLRSQLLSKPMPWSNWPRTYPDSSARGSPAVALAAAPSTWWRRAHASEFAEALGERYASQDRHRAPDPHLSCLRRCAPGGMRASKLSSKPVAFGSTIVDLAQTHFSPAGVLCDCAAVARGNVRGGRFTLPRRSVVQKLQFLRERSLLESGRN